jgi:hypothetical protein
MKWSSLLKADMPGIGENFDARLEDVGWTPEVFLSPFSV